MSDGQYQVTGAPAWRNLLPLRGVILTLRFVEKTRTPFFHQYALSAFLRHLTGAGERFDSCIRIDAPESGRISYQSGDLYRFAVIALAGGEDILSIALDRLANLPQSGRSLSSTAPFARNVRLHHVHDWLSGDAIDTYGKVRPLTPDLAPTIRPDDGAVRLRVLTPARLLKAANARTKSDRFIRGLEDFDDHLLGQRIADTFADLLRRRHGDPSIRGFIAPSTPILSGDLFWVTAGYQRGNGRHVDLSGVAGELLIDVTDWPNDWKMLLWLSQFLGIGQNGAFGCGRMTLQDNDNLLSTERLRPACSMLYRAFQSESIGAAWRHVNDDYGDNDPDIDDPLAALDEPTDADTTAIATMAEAVLNGTYKAPPQRGCLIPKSDGGVRALAIPPRRDRALQRAVQQTLSGPLDTLMGAHSYGYRAGRSRLNARDKIQSAWRDGYRHVVEGDIRDFFGSVDHQRLKLKLEVLYPNDPVVDAIMAWMTAPVDYEGTHYPRTQGLPQGSPLSPLLANLLLDDFDRELEAAGFLTVRFADDFVILCKHPDRAEQAFNEAQQALADLGLELHPTKSRITALDSGVRYLGYLFVGDLALDVGAEKNNIARPTSDEPPWLRAMGARPIKKGHTA
ncbi:reverse transcriptase domain-containing protein, partial [Gammaproteobacteria bacterium]|nr:reverse transcriptase domain-containing protein [Gammaproteobacteria bacterium]